MRFYSLFAITLPLFASQLEQCISEYNSLLNQCQSEINRAGSQINSLAQQVEIQSAHIATLEADQVGLFSFAYLRRHVEHFFPDLNNASLLPPDVWTQISALVDSHLRVRIPFLAAAPAEDLLLFSFLLAFVAIRVIAFFASFLPSRSKAATCCATPVTSSGETSKCPVSGKK
jgi:hypothetical protein